MNKYFTERIFTPKPFFRDLGFLAWHLPGIIGLFANKLNSEHLLEKIFIVTDAVNGCIYCSWMDSKLALKSGISADEIANMLKLQFHADASEDELNALLFTQHYAESNGSPDQGMLDNLYAYYGDKTAKDILLAIRAVTFGNLYFNTWRAVISRIRGKPAEHSNALFEFVYFLLNTPIILPFVIIRKFDRKSIKID